MKKKGLIISTIVMVVVLIASLTTATYAWFNASSFAAVDQIALNVGAASSVAIGVKSANNADTSQASYMSGQVSYGSDGLWADGNNVLGSSISTGLTLNISAAVGSGASGYHYTAIAETALISGNYIELSGNEYVWKDGNTANTTLWTFNSGNSTYVQVNTTTPYSSSTTYYTRADAAREMDATYNAAHSLYKALGDSFASLDVPEDAIINGYSTDPAHTAGDTDVLDFAMAINPVKAGIYGTFCVITIKPTGNFVGMASAIWADITTPNHSATGIDLFDLLGTAAHWDTSNTGEYKFYFMIDTVSGTEMTANDATVTPFSLRLFVSGYDEDCLRSATGTGATIDIQFYGVTKSGSNYIYGDGEYNNDTLKGVQAITGFAHA